MDPNSENFCAYFTPLPTLGGTNASFGAINNLGAESGYAENKHRYPLPSRCGNQRHRPSGPRL